MTAGRLAAPVCILGHEVRSRAYRTASEVEVGLRSVEIRKKSKLSGTVYALDHFGLGNGHNGQFDLSCEITIHVHVVTVSAVHG